MISVEFDKVAASPKYSELSMDHYLFMNDNFFRYKIGDQYYCYDKRKNDPKHIQIHAIVSLFENFLNIPIKNAAQKIKR